MQTRKQAKNEIMEFKKDLQYYSDLYGHDQDWSWNDHDDVMFNSMWSFIDRLPNYEDFVRVHNCSFADCTHFFFEFKKGILDFTVDDPEQTDIWENVNYYSRDSYKV